MLEEEDILARRKRTLLEALRSYASHVLGTIFHPAQPRERSADMLSMLQPEDEDYELVLRGAAAVRARRIYGRFWRERPIVRPEPSHRGVVVEVARADDLSDDDERPEGFPDAYRGIAPLLEPRRVWACWRFADANGTAVGQLFDGLVSIGNRWAWFPRLWEVLDPRPEHAEVLGYWSE
jgi:hypothetical protein